MHPRFLATLLLAPAIAAAQPPSPGPLSIDRVFRSTDFLVATAPDVQWMRDGRSYAELRAVGGGRALVRVDVVTGQSHVLVPASALVDARGKPLDVASFELSPDERKALLFGDAVRVWRKATRGVYHVVDFATGKVVPIATITTPGTGATGDADTMPRPALGGERASPASRVPSFVGRGLASGAADPALQQFAKFSPDSRRVAFVRANDLWVTELATGRSTRLTRDGSDDIINGTSDWVHEEELGLSDAFRWSPDSRRLAYWRFDQSAVPAYPIVDETGAVYPVVSVLRYPKAGAPNARVKVGVVSADGGATRWLAVGPDTGQYLARMDWVTPDSLAVQRLPRTQDRIDVLIASATTGQARTIVSDRDSAYADVEGDAVRWLADKRRFLLRSDRSGWRQWYLYGRDGRLVRRVTQDGMDVTDVAAVDEANGQLYVVAAAPSSAERQIFRCPLTSDGACERVTREPGTHEMKVSPGARYAFATWSRTDRPPRVTLYELPAMREVRVLQRNDDVAARLAALPTRTERIALPMPDGTRLDAYRIVPPDFDTAGAVRYPVLFHTYGGPASPRAVDSWGGRETTSPGAGRDFLFHHLLAQQGYVVIVLDPRGASWRGRDFRMATQLRLGVQESQDVIDAARWAGARPWVDPKRLGMWGWSYGGYLTALTLARGGDLFRAGVVVAPVVDWRLYDTIYTERFMRTPQTNAQGYAAGSVLAHVPTLTAPLLLVHGTGDDNVHAQNTALLVEALVAANKPFIELLYPNRTHSISGGNTTRHVYGSIERFLREKL